MKVIKTICRFVRSILNRIKESKVQQKIDMMQSDKVKDQIAYLVSYSNILTEYKKSLQADHEPDEIAEQMRLYDDRAKDKAKFFSKKFGTNYRVFDSFSFDDQKQQVVSSANNLYSMRKIDASKRAYFIRDFIVQYGDVHKLNAEKLHALVTNDSCLAKAIEEVCPS